MENNTKINLPAFFYRFVFKEIIGLCIVGAITVFIGVVLSMLKLPHASFYTLISFSILFLIQLAIVFFPAFFEYNNLQYSLEQNSISLRKGVFSVDTETIPFQKIKNSSFEQSFMQRLFSVGNIIIDQDDEKFLWEGIDTKTASIIMKAVAARSNLQPIVVSQSPTINTPPTNTTN